MTNYTFAELLTVFFHLHQDLETKKTQAELAHVVSVSRRTIAGWFAGDYAPRTPDVVEKLAQALCLTPFQADLLFYAVNPAWVKYGTPHAVLEMAEVIRYREEEAAYKQTPIQAAPALPQIEREWRLVFRDTFESKTTNAGVWASSRTAWAAWSGRSVIGAIAFPCKISIMRISFWVAIPTVLRRRCIT